MNRRHVSVVKLSRRAKEEPLQRVTEAADEEPRCLSITWRYCTSTSSDTTDGVSSKPRRLQPSQLERDHGPVLGLFEVAVSVEIKLHRCLHGQDLGRVRAIKLLHLGPAPLAGSVRGRRRAAPRGDVPEVPVGRHVAFVQLVLDLLLLLCKDKKNAYLQTQSTQRVASDVTICHLLSSSRCFSVWAKYCRSSSLISMLLMSHSISLSELLSPSPSSSSSSPAFQSA